MTMSYLFLFLNYLVITGPGIIIAIACFRNMHLFEKLLAGAVLGTGLFILVSYIFHFASHVFIMNYLLATYLSAILVAYLRLKKDKTHSSALIDLPPKKDIFLLVILLFSVCLSRLIPLYFSELPPGWDPCFHLILAKKILIENALPVNWKPFEDIPLHYPLGSHILVAGLSKFANQEIYQSFKICFSILAVLTAAQIYLLGLSLSGNRRSGLAAAFSYAFLANFGSLDYYRWGGLPNMMGMLFLISALWALIALSNPYSFMLGGLFLADIYLTHHHSMISAFIIIAAIIITSVHKKSIIHFKNQGRDRFAINLLLALAVSFLLTSFYLPNYLLRAFIERNQTGIFTFMEHFIGIAKVIKYVGLLLLVMAVFGVRPMLNNKFTAKLIFSWFISLTAVFIFFEYIYRLIAMRIYGKDLVAFTPSRFLTDTVYPLSFIAGAGLLRIISPFKFRWSKGALVMLLTVYSVSIIALQVQYIADDINNQEAEALVWIQKNTPENALIINNPDWMPYISWREGTNTPLPISEMIGNEVVRYKCLLQKLSKEENITWVNKNRRPVYFYLTASTKPRSAQFNLVFKNNAARIYRLELK